MSHQIPAVCVRELRIYDPEQECVCGVLRKKGAEDTSWKSFLWHKRWFWVPINIPDRSNYQLFYTGKKMRHPKPRRSFHLVGAKIIVHTANMFSIQFPNYIITLKCETPAEMQNWTSSLAHIITVADMRATTLQQWMLYETPSFDSWGRSSSQSPRFSYSKIKSTDEIEMDSSDESRSMISSYFDQASECTEEIKREPRDLTEAFLLNQDAFQAAEGKDISPMKSTERNALLKEDKQTILRSPPTLVPDRSHESPSDDSSRPRTVSIPVSYSMDDADLAQDYQERRDRVISVPSPERLLATFSSDNAEEMTSESNDPLRQMDQDALNCRKDSSFAPIPVAGTAAHVASVAVSFVLFNVFAITSVAAAIVLSIFVLVVHLLLVLFALPAHIFNHWFSWIVVYCSQVCSAALHALERWTKIRID